MANFHFKFYKVKSNNNLHTYVYIRSYNIRSYVTGMDLTKAGLDTCNIS